MKILILGGTGFSGRILTENLIASGVQPVLFNRGKRNPGIFPELKKIYGDRESDDIKQIAAEEWDVVVDFWGQYPDNIELIADILKGKAGRYIFISTASVYIMDNNDYLKEAIREDFPVHPCTEAQRKDRDFLATYSQKKSECERVLMSAAASNGLDVIIFRPALIYGRYDPTDRFYYWLYRAKNINKVLIPDNGVMRITNTYSEDFAKLIQSALTVKYHRNIYNAVTHAPVTIKEIIYSSAKLLGTQPEFISAPRKFIEDNAVRPWLDIPLWLDGSDLVLDNSKLKEDFDVEFKSFEDSLKGCIGYYTSLRWQKPKYGLSPEKESELINTLQQKSS